VLRAATFQAFERASFLPHALDDRWTGPRRFASWNHTLDAGVTHLEVAHGVPPWQAPGPQVRVDTRRAAPDQLDFELDELVQDQCEALFRETGVLCEDLLDADFSVDDADLVVGWNHADIELDDVPLSFRVLGHDDFWVGHAISDDVLIGIEASAWPLEQTGLVSVRDFAPYDAGLREAMRI
jgi:hypothetical protein